MRKVLVVSEDLYLMSHENVAILLESFYNAEQLSLSCSVARLRIVELPGIESDRLAALRYNRP